MKKRIIVKIFFLIFILILTIYSIFIEPNKLNVSQYILEDNELSGVKIVFVSDFHIKPKQQKCLEKVVELINSQEADLVLSVGDFVSGHSKKMSMSIEDIAKELGKIQAKFGFYTTLGNHDSYYGKELVAKTLKENNIKVLENENIVVKINNKNIYIAGIEDLTTGKPNIYKALSNTKPPYNFLNSFS